MHHSFDIHLAEKYGIHEAIIIHHFQHWIRVNKRLKRNFHEGRTWTYQTRGEINAHLPYLSDKEIRGGIERLVEKEVLLKSNYNKTSFDRTSWYAFVNEDDFLNISYDIPKGPMESDKRANRNSEKGQPIPDTKTDAKTNCSVLFTRARETRVKKLNMRKEEIDCSLDDVYTKIVQNNDKFETSDIEKAWDALLAYQGAVSDAYKFVKGTIENMVNSRNAKKQKESNKWKKSMTTKSMTSERPPIVAPANVNRLVPDMKEPPLHSLL